MRKFFSLEVLSRLILSPYFNVVQSVCVCDDPVDCSRVSCGDLTKSHWLEILPPFLSLKPLNVVVVIATYL